MRQLTSAELASYRNEGFVVIPDFFAIEEIAALQAEVAALQAAGKLRNVVTDGDGQTHSTTAFNLQICPIGLPNSPLIASLPWRAGMADTLRALLGGDAVQHLDQIFLKPARHGAGTNWHTDNAYFKAADPRFGVGMWIAIHDAHRANGTMRFIPRSHLRTWAHQRDGGSDHHITCAAEIDDTQEVLVEVPAGGVAFFNYGVAHSTRANTTARERAALALHFMLGSNVAHEDGHFKDQPENTWRWLSGPLCDGGKTYHGKDLRGGWDAEVGRLSSHGNLVGSAV